MTAHDTKLVWHTQLRPRPRESQAATHPCFSGRTRALFQRNCASNMRHEGLSHSWSAPRGHVLGTSELLSLHRSPGSDTFLNKMKMGFLLCCPGRKWPARWLSDQRGAPSGPPWKGRVLQRLMWETTSWGCSKIPIIRLQTIVSGDRITQDRLLDRSQRKF